MIGLETLEILEPGLLTTVQDKGRYGYQRFGVPVSGAMDAFALRAANALLGNDDGAAGLEITVLGPKVRFLEDTVIAVTGGDLSPALNDQPLPLWRTVPASRDDVLSFHGALDGMRAYLAIAGGIDVPMVMGSRSTYLTSAIGGLDGRALAVGDVLKTFPQDREDNLAERSLPEDFTAPRFGREHELRVVLGPQDGAFAPEAISTFLGSEYSVSMDSDRMGCRLEGPVIEHSTGPDIVSDGSPLGAVQVPGDGSPIVLLADRGTTGGYTKLATVVSVDVGKLAQAMPGDKVALRSVTVEDGVALRREQEAVLGTIRRGARRTVDVDRRRIVVGGQAFEALNEDGAPITLPEEVGDSGNVQSQTVKATVDGRSYDFEVEVQKKE